MKTKKQKPDIWLRENESTGKFDKCACRLEAEYREPRDNGTPAFFMCPLHAAAPKLLAASQNILANWETKTGNDLAAAVRGLAAIVDDLKRKRQA